MYVAVANMEEQHTQETTDDSRSERIKVKVPRRVLHFSDGTLEEYSDDETDSAQVGNEVKETVDTSTMGWGSWLAYKTWAAGSSTLAALDYVGEGLASFLGITTPKYHFEIEEYKRREAERKAEEEQRVGWTQSDGDDASIQMATVNQPKKDVTDVV